MPRGRKGNRGQSEDRQGSPRARDGRRLGRMERRNSLGSPSARTVTGEQQALGDEAQCRCRAAEAARNRRSDANE